MSKLHFTKMHGTGNDYVYVNLFTEQVDDASKLAVFVSDRHFGIGSDGLILIAPSKTADCRMIMYNADGSEGAMCVRKLVNARLPDKSSNRSHTRVSRRRPLAFLLCRRLYRHRAELIHLKRLIVKSHPLLTENDRSRRSRLYKNRRHQHHR